MDKQYAGLRDMAEERKRKLENMYHLFQLKRETDDLEQWITEKELVASSPEMGQDFDHVSVSTATPFFVFLEGSRCRRRHSRYTHSPCQLQGTAQRRGCSDAHWGSPGESVPVQAPGVVAAAQGVCSQGNAATCP